MKANFYLSPLDYPLRSAVIPQPMRLLSLFEHPDVQQNDLGWLKENAAIALDGEIIPPDRWHHIILKPAPKHELNIVVVPKGKKVFAILAAVAVVALTAGIAAFGIPFLGAGFAAGTLGANLVAAGVGIAGSLLINALSAPPKVGNSGEERTSVNAGVSGNLATLLDVLPCVIGTMGASPPFLMPAYTTWDGDDLYINAAVGLQGRCAITDVKINGLPIDQFAKVTYEAREGRIGDDPRTMFLETVIEERDGVTLTNFITELATAKNDTLKDQVTPANSSPQWHVFQTTGDFTEAVFRFMFPSGIVDVANNRSAVVPLRIDMRKKGDSTWRKGPTIHFQDVRKGGGPMRAEVRVKRGNPPDGRNVVWGGQEFPVYAIRNSTGYSKAWAYQSDDYFGSNQQFDFYGLIGAALTSNSSASPYVISASTENGAGNAAWKSLDVTGVSTYWEPTTAIGSWIKWDFGSAKTLKSYEIRPNYSSFTSRPATCPTQWYLEGSNDNSNWTLIHTIDDTNFDNRTHGNFNIKNPGSYRYYRWTFTAIKSGSTLRISWLVPRLTPAYGSYFDVNPDGGESGFPVLEVRSLVSYVTCMNAHITETGCEIYLNEDDWDAGEYEFRLKRGWALAYANLTSANAYEVAGSQNLTYLFDAQLSGGLYKIYYGQKDFRSDMTVEAFQTIDANESPFDDTGIACILLSVPNVQVNSIYAVFQKYASTHSGGIWQAEKSLTNNVAAHYRDILLGEGNADPVGGEVIDEDGLAAWYAKGYEVNAVLQGVRVSEAKQVIATAGYASVRDSRVYGVIEDEDTSADPIRYLIAPHNSKSEGNVSEIRKLPHAIRAEFNNEALSYAVDHVFVYRPGYDANTATLFETINYTGITNEAAVIARATFDLRQSYLRQARYSREVGLEFLGIQRGDVVGLSDDTIDGNTAGGWIKSVQYSGSNIVSVTLDNIMPWSLSTSIESAEDIESITDIVNPAEPMALAIKIPGQDLVYKQVSTVTDDNVCTFTTPFTDDGSIVPGLLAVCGTYDRPVRRCRVLQVIPRGYERRLVIMTDEAPELYA